MGFLIIGFMAGTCFGYIWSALMSANDNGGED